MRKSLEQVKQEQRIAKMNKETEKRRQAKLEYRVRIAEASKARNKEVSEMSDRLAKEMGLPELNKYQQKALRKIAVLQIQVDRNINTNASIRLIERMMKRLNTSIAA